jgi:hypothetical protein
MNPKNRYQPGLQSETAVFWHLQAFDEFKFSPLKQDLSKSRCTVGSNYEQRFFDLWGYLMSLRTPSWECEAKNRCTVGHNYEQRFFGVRGYLVSLNSRPIGKI